MRQPIKPQVREPETVAVVGSGRLGTAIAGALETAGVDVVGPLGREPVPSCDAVLLCVPDDQIAAAAATVEGSAPLVGHTSGATPLSALASSSSEGFGLHPLQTFAGGDPPVRFHGAGCAIAGTGAAALATARALAERLGMRPFEIADSGRAAYHAAASISSNFLVTLQAAAETVAAGAGLSPEEARRLLAPLVLATVENWAAAGPRDALTGPVARGDSLTVQRQRVAVRACAPELAPLFDQLVEQTKVLAGRGEEVPA